MRNPFKREPDVGVSRGYSEMFRSVRRRERRHLRHRWQWIALGVFAVIAVIGALVAWQYFSLQGDIRDDGVIPNVSKPPDDGPFNALLIGSDSRKGLTPEEQHRLGAGPVEGKRADTLILAHVDPATEHITMVQFPRDLWVRIPGASKNRINWALMRGTDRLVETVENVTGLSIHHTVELNIAGFRDLVDAIAGVEVCVPERIPFDPHTGIEIEEPGLVRFDGDKALRFVRSRNFPSGDFARIQNQQRFIAAAIDKVTSIESLLHPSRITSMMRIAGDNLRVDQHQTPLGLYRLAQSFRSLRPDDYEAYTVPNHGSGTVRGASVVLPDREAMNVMFRAIGRNESPAEADGVPNIDPRGVKVDVYNGTRVDGLAKRAARKLKDVTDVGKGPVDVRKVANADRAGYRRTVIRYGPDATKAARLVAAAIPGAALEQTKTRPGIDVAVVVGRRFEVKKVVQLEPIPVPKPGELPAECR